MDRQTQRRQQTQQQQEGLKKAVEWLTSPRAKRFATILLCMTLVGILIGTLAPSPIKMDGKKRSEYQAALVSAENVPGYHEAADDLNYEQGHVDQAKVWFWRFRSEHRKEVYKREEKKSVALARFQKKKNERHELVRQAKASVGIWSPYGIEETREQFWQTFQEGKDMGKRMTFYDMFFSMFNSRNEDGAAFVMRWVIRILMNYTIGMFVAVIRFLFQLGSIVWSYSPNPASGFLFFFVAAFAACSLIGAFVLLMYASCVGCFLFLANSKGTRRPRGADPDYQRLQHAHRD
jgi:hypothetical protein